MEQINAVLEPTPSGTRPIHLGPQINVAIPQNMAQLLVAPAGTPRMDAFRFSPELFEHRGNVMEALERV